MMRSAEDLGRMGFGNPVRKSLEGSCYLVPPLYEMGPIIAAEKLLLCVGVRKAKEHQVLKLVRFESSKGASSIQGGAN